MRDVPGYVDASISGGGISDGSRGVGASLDFETGGGGGGGRFRFANIQPPTVTRSALEKSDVVKLDPREKDGTFNREDDPLLRRPVSLDWGGSEDNLARLSELGRSILARLPVPVAKSKEAGAGTGRKGGASGKTGAAFDDVQSLFNEFDDGSKAPSNASTGRASVAIPTPVPVSSGGSSLGLILAVLGILATIGGILYYEYKHKAAHV